MFELNQSIKTDTEEKSYLCSTISSGVIDSYSIICTAADRICILFVVQSSSNNELHTERKLEFQADNNEVGCINCCMVTPVGDIITASDDGIIRIWSIDTSSSTDWVASLVAELNGHEGPIMALSIHPSEPLLCSASKDGSLKLWSLLTYRLEDSVRCSDGVSGGSIAATSVPTFTASTNPTSTSNISAQNNEKSNVSQIPLGKLPNVPTPASQASRPPNSATSSQPVGTIECRGCCFSPSGTEVIVIQSGKRGAAFMVKWKLSATSLDSNYYSGDDFRLKLSPIAAIQVSKVPCTRLCISSSGQVAAVGSSDGSIILVHNIHEEKMILGKVFECHQLPVTGITFAPSCIRSKTHYDEMILSCSADYTLAMNAYNASYFTGLTKSSYFQIIFVVFTILLTLLLVTSTVILFESCSPNNLPIL
jgi:hypothetical protein